MKFVTSFATCLLAVGALSQATADKKQLASLTASYKVAKAAYKLHASGVTKHQLVIATDRLATATMTSEVLSPRLRYPQALALYQEALNLDPTNKEAGNNAQMIDGVYSGMIHGSKAKMTKDPNDKQAAAEYARLTSIYKKIHRPIP